MNTQNIINARAKVFNCLLHDRPVNAENCDLSSEVLKEILNGMYKDGLIRKVVYRNRRKEEIPFDNDGEIEYTRKGDVYMDELLESYSD